MFWASVQDLLQPNEQKIRNFIKIFFKFLDLKYLTQFNEKEKMQSSTQVHREALQRQTQQDWANREYIELVIVVLT
jgi:hypothetical protein